MMRFGYGGLGMLAGGLIGLLLFLLFTALVVLAIVALVKYIHRQQKRDVAPASSSPAPVVNPSLQILDERLAKGEIDEEEYKRKKELLTK